MDSGWVRVFGMTDRRSRAWQHAGGVHAAAADDLVAAVRALPDDAWQRPLADGKWTPAQIVHHLNLTYDVLLGELAGGAGMKVRTRPWQRVLLRATVARRILGGKGFPRAAPAPREIRPEGDPGTRDEALAGFRDRAERFTAAAEEVRTSRPRARLTHAYFGEASVAEGVLLCGRHIQHHTAQLRALLDGSSP